MRTHWRLLAAITAFLAVFAAACGGGDGETSATATEAGGAATEAAAGATEVAADGTGSADGSDTATEGDGSDQQLSGTIEVDGSSTVAPLTNAIYEEYSAENPEVTVNVGVSGTGGGFERFCGSGDTDISNASRPIGEDEVQLCADNGIEYTEIRVGTDALTMVVNPQNEWVDCLNNDQIQQIWSADRAQSWADVEGIDEDQPITIFAPASTSGTYDFFNETVGVEEPTQDYSATENDNDIVRGVSGEPGGWGYFGFAFFQENEGTVKALAYDAGEGCVEPSVENAQNDTYGLTRPLFIYVNNEALSRPEIEDFATFYLENVGSVIEQVGYIPAPEETIQESMATLEQALQGAG